MAAEQLTDKENQFRKRARRRLVGAVALVLLMVTVLPMVLDDRGSQKTPQPEIAISIPSQDGTDFSSKIIPASPVQPVEPPVQMASPIGKPQEVTISPALPAEPAKPKSAVSVVEKPLPVPAEPAPLPEKPVSAPAKVVPEPHKALAEVKSKPVAKVAPVAAGTVKKGSVSVQVGVFSDAAKVKQMRAKIAESGIQCYTEDMNTPKGVKIRLRCGPFAARTEAQQALEQLKASGFGGILVTNQ